MFTKTLDELITLQARWANEFRHLPELANIPAEHQNSFFEKLVYITKIYPFKPEEREAYQQSLEYYRGLKDVIDTAYADGLARGKQERAAAYHERLDTAKNLKNLGLSNEQIATATGLPLAEITDL
jgi:hypothetical protein